MRLGFFALLTTGVVLVLATFLLVRYAQGYRIVFDGNDLTKDTITLAGTGLLAATSTPDGASVYIDNKLVSATNATINLKPGEYTVKIIKEGYLPWEKKLKVQEEIVTQTQALLFPTAPKLESLTSTGALNPTVDHIGTSIAFGVASASAAGKNGVYLFDMGRFPIPAFRNSLIQLADNTSDIVSSSHFIWSPSGQELLATTSRSKLTYRLKTTEFNKVPPNITQSAEFVKTQWENERETLAREKLNTLKPELSDFISKHFRVHAWSVDNTKVLYEATGSAIGSETSGSESNTVLIPKFLNPPLIGANSQPEERTIQKGKFYVYDTKEDKNFFVKDVDSTFPNPVWFPDNRHLVFVTDKQIKIIEYDGSNETIVYAGPFDKNFVYPWPDGSRLVILTSLNPQAGIAPNLYTINLK